MENSHGNIIEFTYVHEESVQSDHIFQNYQLLAKDHD